MSDRIKTSLRHTNSVQLDSRKFNLEMAKRGLDGEKLAALSGLNRATISDARSGKFIHVATAGRISKALESVPILAIAEVILKAMEATEQ